MNFLSGNLGFPAQPSTSNTNFKGSSNETTVQQEQEMFNSLISDMLGTPGEVFFADASDATLVGKKDLHDLSSFLEMKQFSFDQLRQECDQGNVGIFHFENEEGKEKPNIRCFSELRPAFDGSPLELHRRGKNGKKTVTTLDSTQYSVSTFTPEQRARISQIAFTIFRNSTSMPKESDLDDKLQNKNIRLLEQRESKYQNIQNKFSDMKNLRTQQNDTDKKNQQFKETEQATEEKRFEEDKTKKLDEKSTKKHKFYRIQDEKRDLLKFDTNDLKKPQP